MKNLSLSFDENLENAKNLQEVFAAIAHQWRAPLSQINSIVGSIDNRLYEQKIDDSFLVEKLLQIEAITKEMSESIDDYRTYFSKNNEKHSLYDLIAKSLVHDIAMIEQKGIVCKIMIDKEIEFIGDKQLFKQIIATLLDNAKDALLERNIYDPSIKIDAYIEEEGNFLVCSVCDNAGGISKSVMKKIFEPSFTTKHSSEGTGLGLFMVQKLLDEKMHASIDVKNVESGVCFRLKIPRDRRE